eukprot:GHVP01033568.1.p2 GENE.GHVP01033568.1~~GHVP01033568.1.p2  ORF type:complete len:101 (-),score=19.19 GHVP01033568.1:79-381(-)
MYSYQDDIAVACESPEETIKLAQLAKDVIRFAGLLWIPTKTKPLLRAIWAPNVIFQKPEAFDKLQKLHEDWRSKRPKANFPTKNQKKFFVVLELFCDIQP